MSKTQKEKAFVTAKQIFWEMIGSILIAIGVYNFAVHAEFPMTGFSGISIILYRLWSIPIGFSTILLNIPVAILCWKLLGKGFFLRSVRCTIISSVIMDYIAPLFPMYEGSRLLAALCTGVFAGLGYSLIYMQNSSTGGADFIIMAIKALRPHMGVGRISFVIDAVIIVLGTMVFQDVDGIIYGMIVSFLLATVIDKVMYGMNAGKMALIVTDDGKKICDVIEDCCQRGSTILKAQGGYQQEEREVVMCACNNKEMYLVQQAVKEADPASFMIVLESNEVHGEGFRTIQVGEKVSGAE